MYDYDRRDKFGNKRELHVDKALDVVDTKRYVPYESSINAMMKLRMKPQQLLKRTHQKVSY